MGGKTQEIAPLSEIPPCRETRLPAAPERIAGVTLRSSGREHGVYRRSPAGRHFVAGCPLLVCGNYFYGAAPECRRKACTLVALSPLAVTAVAARVTATVVMWVVGITVTASHVVLVRLGCAVASVFPARVENR